MNANLISLLITFLSINYCVSDESKVEFKRIQKLLYNAEIDLRRGEYSKGKQKIGLLRRDYHRLRTQQRFRLNSIEADLIANADGDYGRSVELTIDCLGIARELDDKSRQWRALRKLGNFSNCLGRKLLATQYHQQALDLAIESQNYRGMDLSRIDLVNCYLTSGLIDRGQIAYGEINQRKDFETSSHQYQIITILLLFKTGEIDKAIELFKTLDEYYRVNELRMPYELILLGGEIYLDCKKYGRAKKCFGRLLRERGIMSRTIRSRTSLGMAKVEMYTGQFTDSLLRMDALLTKEYLNSLKKEIFTTKIKCAGMASRHDLVESTLGELAQCELEIESSRMSDELMFLEQQDRYREQLQAREIAEKDIEILKSSLAASRNSQKYVALIAFLVLSGVVISGSIFLRKRMVQNDLKNERLLSEEKSKLNFELQQKIKQRVDQLRQQQNERLRLEQQLNAKRRDEALGKLTGGVAHDFNNLITVVQNVNELITSEFGEQIPGCLHELIDCSSQATQTASEITDRLLMFAKQQKLQPEHICLSEFFDKYRALIQQSSGPRNRLNLVVDENANIYADQTQFLSALINLCANANEALLGASEHAEVNIVARCIDFEEWELETKNRFVVASELQPSDKVVVVSVKDNGAGMSDAVAQKACEPFFSTKAESPSQSRSGVGLGLSVVKGFLEQSEAGLYIYSEPSVGTIVRMAFQATNLKVDYRKEPGNANSLNVHGLRVLLVDDNEMILQTVAYSLETQGCRVYSFNSGTLAQNFLRESGTDIDVLLSDIRMPNSIDGISLANWTAKNFAGVGIVLMTGYSEKQLCDEFPILSKPFQQIELVKMIQSVARSNKAPDDRF